MKEKIGLIIFGIAVAAYLGYGEFYGSKEGASAGIQHCYNNATEEPAHNCGERAAAFQKKYGHAFDE